MIRRNKIFVTLTTAMVSLGLMAWANGKQRMSIECSHQVCSHSHLDVLLLLLQGWLVPEETQQHSFG